MSPERAPEESSILRHTPNGVLLVDEREVVIRFANPAFERMFGTGGGPLVGRKAAEVLGSDCFERAIASGGETSVQGSVPERGFFYRAGLFPIEGEGRYCGIFIDTTEEEHARAQLREARRRTLEHAQEVIQRQMKTAQEIAGLLGETTAETKVLLAKLMDLFRREGPK